MAVAAFWPLHRIRKWRGRKARTAPPPTAAAAAVASRKSVKEQRQSVVQRCSKQYQVPYTRSVAPHTPGPLLLQQACACVCVCAATTLTVLTPSFLSLGRGQPRRGSEEKEGEKKLSTWHAGSTSEPKKKLAPRRRV